MKLSIAARVLLAPIRVYQRAISPALPPTCRYYPSCSSYAVESLQLHGAVRGSWLAARRVSRCHPWHAGGYDPVPARRERERPADSSIGESSASASRGTDSNRQSGTQSSVHPDARLATAETPNLRSNAA